MPVPNFDTLAPIEETSGPDFANLEPADTPKPPAFTPFTGRIPIPPDFDPVTMQKRYGGPWSGGITSPWAPEAMQEAAGTLRAPLRAAGALTEGLMGTASEMASDFLRRSGIDPSAQSGQPLAAAPPPGAGKTLAAALTPFKQPLPPWAQGALEEGGNILRSFTEPGQAATLPFAAASKPVQALYLTGAAAAIPESLQRIQEAQTPEEMGAAITGGAANIGMAELMRRGLVRPTPIERLIDASKKQEAATVYGDVRPQPGEGQGQVPAQEGGRGIQPPSFPQEVQVLLDQGLANNRSLGIGHELEVLPDFGPADPTHRRVFQATAPTVDAEGKVTAPGKIRMSREAFNQWIAFVPEAERATAVQSALAEEGIHATVTKGMADEYLKSLSPAEIAAGKKLYLGGVSEAEAGLTETNLGHELLRQRMQRLLRMRPTELAETAGFEKWSRATIEALARVIRNFREFFGTEAAKAGGKITDELLNQYQDNLNAVARASGEAEPFPERYGGEQPFMIRRGAGEKKPDEIAGMDNAAARQFFKDIREKGIAPQYDSVVAGMKLSEKDLPELQKLHEQSGKAMMAALESGDQKAFEAQFGKNVWYAGAIEGARRQGPNYERLQQDIKNAEIPGLPPVPRGTIRLYHGEGGPEGAGMFSSWFSEDASRASSYGGQVSYVDIPESVAQVTRQMAKKAGSGTAADHFLPDEWAMRAEAVPEAVQQKVYDLGPAALRRGKAKEGTRELFLPPAGGEARPSAAEMAFKPATPVNVSRRSYAELQNATDRVLEEYKANPAAKIDPPSFKEFSKNLQVEFGQMQPGAVVDQWQQTIWRRLLNASGEHLEALRQATNLRAKLGDRPIADPPPRAREQLTAETTGEARAQISAEQKGAAARQKYRNNVISQVAEALMKQAVDVYQLDRKTIGPEDIGFQRKSSRPAWNTITTEDRANPLTLDRLLTDDAREMGLPVSTTKRLTVLQNIATGKVEMVSTYRDPRRGAVLLDPDAPGKTHSRLDSMLKRWRPIQSVLLDTPVKNFQQSFKNLIDFEENFGKEARSRYVGSISEEPAPTTAEPLGEPERAGSWESRTPVTAPEAEAILNSVFEEVGVFDSPNDVKEALSSRTIQRNKAAVSGLRKLAARIDQQSPDLSLEQLLDRLSTQIYENHKQAKSVEEFQSRTVAQGPPPRGEAPAIGAQTPAAAPPTGARELTVPTFARKGTPAPAGPGPEAKLPPPTPPEMLSPEARAQVEWEARQEHKRLPDWYEKLLYTQLANREVPKAPYRIGAAKSIREATAEAGALEDVHSEDMPAMLRRTKQAAEDELKLLARDIMDLAKRQATTQEVAATRDAADTVSNNISRRAEVGIRLQSVKRPPGIVARAFTAWRDGDRNVLTSAPHIVEAGGVRANGTIDLAGVRNALPMFRQLLTKGRTGAQAMIAGPLRVQRLGRAWMREIENLGRELDYLETHLTDPEMQKTAARIAGEVENQYQREMAAGYELTKDPNYLPHRWDAQLWNGRSILFSLVEPGKLLGKKFREAKRFDTVFHAIAEGPYLRGTADGASLASHRIRQGMSMMLRDQWAEGLKGITTPGGKPLAIDPVRLSFQKWGSPAADYEVVGMGGKKPLVIQKDFAPLIANLTGRNVIQDWAFTRGLLNLEQNLKHTLLIGDFFHFGRVSYYAASIMGRKMGWRGGWSALDIDPKDIPEAVQRGIIQQKHADWANETLTAGGRTYTRRQVAEEFQRRGLNVGKIQDALYKDLVTHLTPSAGPIRRGFVALTDPSVGRYNRFLFDKLTRGLMLESAVREFERTAKANPSANLDRIASDISRDVNNYFGNIGRQGWLKAAWQQDLARMFFLAPQWVEGLLKKEGIAYGRAAGAVARGAAGLAGQQLPYRQGLPAMGTLGRGIGRGLGFMFLLTQAINLIWRHQPTFMNEEKEHKFDAYIPAFGGEEGGFWLSPLGLFNEITHDVYRLVQDKPKWIEAISQIAGNKESPLTRAAIVAIGGHSPTGTYLTTSAGQIGTAFEQLAPVPITFGRYARAAGHAIAPGVIEPNLPGAVQRQMYSTFGIKVEPAKSSLQEIQSLAREFAVEKGRKETVHFEETDEPSYSRLRQAVRNSDPNGTFKMLDKLRGQGKTDEQILKAMKIWSQRNFTWSNEAEDEFRWSLTPEQREKMSEAEYQRLAEYQRFLEYFLQQPR